MDLYLDASSEREFDALERELMNSHIVDVIELMAMSLLRAFGSNMMFLVGHFIAAIAAL
jgi:hypothetical protein